MKPVAWMVEGYDGIGSSIKEVVLDKPKPDSWVTVNPLYTAPTELSDEEIDTLIEDVAEKPTDEDLYDFARAILKKVSEK